MKLRLSDKYKDKIVDLNAVQAKHNLVHGYDLNLSRRQMTLFMSLLVQFLEEEQNFTCDLVDATLTVSTKAQVLGRIDFSEKNKMVLLMANSGSAITDFECMKILYMVVDAFWKGFKKFVAAGV